MGARAEPCVAFTLQTHPVLKHEHPHGVGKAHIRVRVNFGAGRDIRDLPGYKQHCINKAINTACFGNVSEGSFLQGKSYYAVPKLAW